MIFRRFYCQKESTKLGTISQEIGEHLNLISHRRRMTCEGCGPRALPRAGRPSWPDTARLASPRLARVAQAFTSSTKAWLSISSCCRQNRPLGRRRRAQQGQAGHVQERYRSSLSKSPTPVFPSKQLQKPSQQRLLQSSWHSSSVICLGSAMTVTSACVTASVSSSKSIFPFSSGYT